MITKEIILQILKEIEDNDNILRIAGGRGYGTGKAYPKKSVGVLSLLGDENNEEEKQYKYKPVKVSKAFDKEGKNGWWLPNRKTN